MDKVTGFATGENLINVREQLSCQRHMRLAKLFDNVVTANLITRRKALNVVRIPACGFCYQVNRAITF
jgi:hypothetical protein